MSVISFLRSRHIRARNDQVTNAAQLTLRQSLWPLTIVTILFFLWGFAYGLLDTLNKHFQNTLGITRTRSSGLQAAYFGAYPLASLGYANWMLRKWGYKSVFIMGLCLYGIGALCMWPAGLHQSFGGFCGATFVIGSGLGSLETAANPYLSVCGPPKYAEIRINFAQAFNAIGTVVGPVLGSYVFFTTTADNVSALQRVQWVYLAIGIFVFCLAGVFYISDIPEVTDADMELQVAITHIEDKNDSFWKRYQLFHAAFAQFLYVGSQVAIASYFINYSVETRPNTSSALGAKFLAGAQGAFTVGRFSGALLMKFIRARWIFLVYLAGVVVFLAASTTQRDNTGIVCFPTIVALGIRGLGKHYKRGSGFIVAGVSGGAAVPPLLGYVADLHNSTGFAMIVPTILMAVAWTYAVCVNFVPSYRDPADKIGDSTVGIVDGREDEEHRGGELQNETADLKKGVEFTVPTAEEKDSR
ncbi:L-fucose permease Glucose/galactose transporter [Microsporum canis CBS 113480]|uniref:L-fucose permease Glucose/galactose transporter n=1 Tax=Arthroderma otae (strain ATCC MYA-4605 / CBS 113480) TaxID=554155 RepID=C5FY06_ARTOC|nr:L-fucose permease Glucose/galactose transporter [Microsporum canis CBS 113480]EEQ34404.1 L-fucose permease Glucose/galactose transporter [Microsporum canis CBS 113480]